MDERATASSTARAWPGFVFGAVWGFGIYALSLPIGGHLEPWDATPGYYPGALVLGGLVAGMLLRARPWALWLGLVVGQAVDVLFVAPGAPLSLWPLSLVFGGASSLIALLGLAVANWLKHRKQAAAR